MNLSISVIITTYNRPQWLRKTIESAANQSDITPEVIIIDDGSSSNQAEIICDDFPGIKYIYQSNQGLGAARNTGISHSHGEFIQFVDDDDWLIKTSIEKKLEVFIKNPNLHVVYSDLFITDETGKILNKVFEKWKRPLPTGDLYPHLIHRNFIPVHALLWKRSALEAVNGFPPRSGYEDWETLLKVAETGQFGCIDQPLGYYRQHPGNMSKSFKNMMAGKLAFQSKIVAAPRFQSLPDQQRKKILIKFALLQSAYGDSRTASQFLQEASTIEGLDWYFKLASLGHIHCPFLLKGVFRGWHELRKGL